MRETYEFRVREEYAELLFKPNEGKKLGWSKLFGDKFVTIRKIELAGDDSRLKKVGELNALIQKEYNDLFFAGWNIKRRYSAKEIKQAKLFLFCHLATFEPAGEECGTNYDETSACPHCKSGAKQVSPLFLDWKRIPKSKNIARTIAGEIVVSKRMVELFERHSITGAEFGPVRHRRLPALNRKTGSNFLLSQTKGKLSRRLKQGLSHSIKMYLENIVVRKEI